VKLVTHEMEVVQRRIQGQPLNDSLHEEEAHLVKFYGDLSRDEENFLRQKSHV